MPQIVEVDVTETGRVERAEPDPPEVVPAQDTTAGADEDEPGSAGGGMLGQVVCQLGHERGREGDGADTGRALGRLDRQAVCPSLGV